MRSDLTIRPGALSRDFAMRWASVLMFELLAGMSFATALGALRAFPARPSALAEVVGGGALCLLFVLEAAFVAIRPAPSAKAPGLAPRVAALLGMWAMAPLVLLPVRHDLPPALSLLAGGLGLAGTGLAVMTVASLSRSFSVMAEARGLVTHGPYRFMRHPLYAAEAMIIAGVVVDRWSPLAVLLFAVQSACQCWRARNEERVLASAFQDFAPYRARTPLLHLPRLDPATLAIAVAAYAVAVSLGARLLGDPDTFLHVAAGKWIWAHDLVPAVDPFSATRLGAPWTAHEWLAELLFGAAYSAFGWSGVTVLAAAAIAATFAVLAAALRRDLPPRGVAAVLALSFLLAAPHLMARPHVLAMPAMAAWVAGLVRARREGRAPSFLLLPLLAAWANLHASFPLALAVAAGLAVEALAAAPDSATRRSQLVGWLVFLAAAAAASFVSPLGIAGWRFSFSLMDMHYALGLVGEWQATNFAHFQPLEVWVLILLAAGLGGSVRMPPLRLAMLLALVHLALGHARFADLLAVLGPLLAGPSLAPLFGALDERRHDATSAWQGLLALVAIAAISAVGLTRGIADDNPRIAPAEAVAALGAGLVFNDYDFGDYLIFRGIPPFVDGRLDLYGDDFMRAYMAALDAEGDALPALLDRYHVRWAILKPDRAAVAELDRLDGWRRVHADGAAVVYVNDRRPE